MRKRWWIIRSTLLVVVALITMFIVGYVRGQQAALETMEVHFDVVLGVTDLELRTIDDIPLPGNRVFFGQIKRGSVKEWQFKAVNVGQERIGLQWHFMTDMATIPATVTLEPIVAVFLDAGQEQVYTLTIDVPITATVSDDYIFHIEFYQ